MPIYSKRYTYQICKSNLRFFFFLNNCNPSWKPSNCEEKYQDCNIILMKFIKWNLSTTFFFFYQNTAYLWCNKIDHTIKLLITKFTITLLLICSLHHHPHDAFSDLTIYVHNLFIILLYILESLHWRETHTV